MVQEQLEEVRQNIRNACERSGRKVEAVTYTHLTLPTTRSV